ncbi:MAG: branched-chain amino acid ABC transporter permease [Promethearchaeota archaeon]
MAYEEIIFLVGAFLVNTLASGLVYSLATTSLTTMYGGLGIPNIALGQFFIIGAYLLYFFYVQLHLNLIISALATMVMLIAFYFLIEKVVFRRFYSAPSGERIVFFVLLTIGMSQILGNIILITFEANTYRIVTPWYYETINVLSFPSPVSYILGITLLSVTLCVLFWFLRYTKYGKAIRALVQDREMTGLMGVNITRMSTLTFLLSSGVASFAGMIYGLMYSFDPSASGMIFSMTFVMMLVGGRGSVLGSMIMGFFFGGLQAALTMFFFPSASLYVFFAVMLIILLAKPEGLFKR